MTWLQRILGCEPYVPSTEIQSDDAVNTRQQLPAVLPAPRISQSAITDNALVIVDLLAKSDESRPVLLAGPFFLMSPLRLAQRAYLVSAYSPCVLGVTPAQYAVLYRGGIEATDLLVDLTAQPNYPGKDKGCGSQTDCSSDEVSAA